MEKRDLLYSTSCAFLISVFLLPTLISTGFYPKVPSPLLLLFVGFPIVTIVGMFTAFFLGKKLALFWQLAKFALVGVLNTAIDFGILNLLIVVTSITSGIGIIFVNAISFSTALVNSYFWNKEWVFSSAKKGDFVTFVVVTIIGLSMNTGIVYFLTTYVPPVFVSSSAQWANLAKVLATGISLVWNFAGYKLVVFKK